MQYMNRIHHYIVLIYGPRTLLFTTRYISTFFKYFPLPCWIIINTCTCNCLSFYIFLQMQFDSSEEAESSELSSDFTEDDESENSINVNNIIKKDTAKASKRQKVDKAAKAANREEQDEIIILEDSKEMPMEAVTEPKKKRAAILVDDGK